MSTRERDGGGRSASELDQELGAPLLAVYGAGTILGAGIYVLIGKLAAQAGLWLPLSFLAAALVALVNGLVYAELSTRTPRAGGPSAYVAKAFSVKWLAVLVGWMIVATGIVSAATITTGFSGYVTHLFGGPEWLVRCLLVSGLALVAALGAKESAWFMAATTTVGVAGLVFVLWVGFFGAESPRFESLDAFWREVPSLRDVGILSGVLSAAFLAVYAFIGFEDIVHMAEEVERPSHAIPLAIVIAIVVAAALYMVVAVAVLMVIDPSTLAGSKAPLVEVVTAGGQPRWPLAVASLWIILNGALAQLVMASRVVYSLGDRGGAPQAIARISERTRTPLGATGLCAAAALALALLFPLETLAAATSAIMITIFAASNAALIALDRRGEAPFDVPHWVPYVGLICCVGLLVGRLVVPGGGH